MSTINLKDFYPLYTEDCYIDVSDEVAETLLAAERKELADRRKMYRHRAHYSLDRGDGIESDISVATLSPYDLYEQKLTAAELHKAIAALPDKQGERIYEHFFLGIGQAEIARTEGVAKSRVSESIRVGLRNLKNLLNPAP